MSSYKHNIVLEDQVFANYASETQRTYKKHLVKFYKEVLRLPIRGGLIQIKPFIENTTHEVLGEWLVSKRNAGLSQGSINLSRAAVVAFAKWLYEEGLAPRQLYADLQIVRSPLSTATRKKHRWLTISEARALLIATGIQSNQVRAVRDRAIVWVMLTLALRRSEVVNLQWENLNGDTLRCQIKGGQLVEVNCPPPTLRALQAWSLLQQQPLEGYIFRQVYRSGKVSHKSLSANGLWKIVRSAWKRSMMGGKPLSPHDLRRTATQLARDDGASIEELEQFLNHKNPSSAAVYVKSKVGRFEGTSQRIANKLT